MIKLGSFLQVLAMLFVICTAFNMNPRIRETTSDIQARDSPSLIPATADASASIDSETSGTVASASYQNSIGEMQGGGQVLQVSALSSSPSSTQHLMCKGDAFDGVRLVPVDPTTIFEPSDIKAECWTEVNISSTIEFKWHYRSSSAKSWVSCYNFTLRRSLPGEYYLIGFLNIAGYWPAYNCPRAYKVDAYLDGLLTPSFSEFFEVTSGGLNSPRMCESIDANGLAVNVTSRFTLGADGEAYHYFRFDKTAYFNERDGLCHNFTTVWTQPGGTVYKSYSGSFPDYKDANLDSDFWESRYVSDDFISINSTTPFGDWKVEVYLDSYFNNTWMPYGPVATTHFVIGSAHVADWTFMVYLDADNSLEAAGVDVFLKLSSVGSSPDVNVVVQMDRHPWYDPHPQLPGDDGDGYDDRYGNWTDCKRFSVTKGMWPTSGNATQDLGEVNMGNPSTLWSFLNWTVSNYPAKYYLLALFDHGTGCMGVSYDETNSNNYLSLPELAQAISGLPVIIDVVLLDACSMGMTEVAYQIRDYTNVLVGPEGLGWAPAPYDNYLSILTSNPSTLPGDFAKQLATDYIDWCMPIPEIKNATMSATDLTKIVALRMAITDFSLKMNETEEIYHEQITLARNMTEQYPGPYRDQSGYYIDLYHFSQLAYQYIPDPNVRNAADQVMNTLESMIIYNGAKALPGSHGLSIFLPHKSNYNYFNSILKNPYLETALARDTPWNECFIYHLNLQETGCQLTIQTPYSEISIIFNEESYPTDASGKLRVFVLPGSYSVEVPRQVLRDPDFCGIFTGWNDYETNASRTILLSNLARVTYTALYVTQYKVTFAQSGLSLDRAEGILTIDGKDYNTSSLPVPFWWNQSTIHTFAYLSVLQVSAKGTRYLWNATTGLSKLRTELITTSASGSIVGYYKTEHYLTVNSAYGSPIPLSGWFESGELIEASIDSLILGSAGTRYLCNGWAGTGSVSASGTINSVSFTLSQPSNITWNWKSQYLLTVSTDPAGLTPEPVVSPVGPWYDSGAQVVLTATQVEGRTFDHWSTDGSSWDSDVNPITIAMDSPRDAIAHYVRTSAWWEILVRSENMQIILGLVGTFITVGLIGTAWIRTRKGRSTVKTFLIEIDDVWVRNKHDPKKCEEELFKLRNTVLEGVTDGKITQEGYEIIDAKLDKCLEELHRK